MKPDKLVYTESSAVISTCGKYRYHLSRTWAPSRLPRVTFLMLNPSIASGLIDDPTIRKCVGFARRMGYGGIDVVNVAAYRATDPIVLYTAQQSGIDVVGPENAQYVGELLNANGLTIAAWGAQRVTPFPAGSEAYLRKFKPVHCLGRTKDNHPRHPLMLPYNTPLEVFV